MVYARCRPAADASEGVDDLYSVQARILLLSRLADRRPSFLTALDRAKRLPMDGLKE